MVNSKTEEKKRGRKFPRKRSLSTKEESLKTISFVENCRQTEASEKGCSRSLRKETARRQRGRERRKAAKKGRGERLRAACRTERKAKKGHAGDERRGRSA